MAKKQKNKFPYKYLRPDQLEELKDMSNEELIKEHLSEQKNIRRVRKAKKEDHVLQDLNKQIKEHRESHQDTSKIKEIQSEIKEMKKAIDLEIEDTILDRREASGGWNDLIKSHVERGEAIFKILDERGINKTK